MIEGRIGTQPQLGERVITKKYLGHSKGYYYHGASLKDIPLGSKGVVIETGGHTLSVMMGTSKHPKITHLLCDEVELYTEDKESKDVGSFLEEIVSDGAFIPTKRQNRLYSLIRNNVLSFFNHFRQRRDKIYHEEDRREGVAEEVRNTSQEQNTEQRDKFNPKFNVREEFAVWIREQFPQLRQHIKLQEIDPALEARREEVIEAARQAYGHARETADGCVLSRFYELSRMLEYGRDHPYEFCYSLDEFVRLIEQVAANLSTNKPAHSGEEIRLDTRRVYGF